MAAVFANVTPWFWVLVGIWFAAEAVVRIRARRLRTNATHHRRDRGSFWLIMLPIGFVLVGSLWLRSDHLGWAGKPWATLGVVAMALGIGLRYWGLWVLGPYYSGRVAVHAEQILVSHGPYRWIRHPAYTGGWLLVMGLGLALNCYWTAVVGGVLLAWVFRYRIRVEEAAMIEQLGPAYRDYRRHTWAMVPGVW